MAYFRFLPSITEPHFTSFILLNISHVQVKGVILKLLNTTNLTIERF